jgi:hypothetical protein
MDRLPSTQGDGRRARERLSHLCPLRGPRRQAAACCPPRAVPHAADPAERRGEAAAAQLLAVGAARAGYYRIAVKREQHGAASGYLHSRLAVGDQLDVAAPRGTFILDESEDPVLLISAGIGATPVLAMLNALAEQHSGRQIWWLHGARNGNEHSFAADTLGRSSQNAPTRALASTTASRRR